VAKPNWGLKRTCASCGAKFYDLGKDHIECPKCGAEFDPDAVLKTKRAKTAAVARPVAAAAEPEPEAEDVEVEAGDDEAGDDEKEDEVIEDTSELGEDDEDVAEVVDKVEDEER
jgi:uncharacterized protein (TIGR02300 family)